MNGRFASHAGVTWQPFAPLLRRVEDLDVRCRARPCPRWPRCSNCDHVRDLKLEHASVMPDFITLDAFLARCRNGARMSQVVGLRCAGVRSAWRRTGFGSMRRGSRGTGPHSTWFTVVHRGSPRHSAPFCHALPPPEVTESPMCGHRGSPEARSWLGDEAGGHQASTEPGTQALAAT